MSSLGDKIGNLSNITIQMRLQNSVRIFGFMYTNRHEQNKS